MRRISCLAASVLLVAICSFQTALAQLPIKVPKVPKADKSKQDPPQTDGASSPQSVASSADSNGTKSTTTGESKLAYVNLYPTSTPQLIKDSIYIQAKTHDSYWKMPNQKNYSSWVPTLRFGLFYDNSNDVKLVAEYSNPDGSPWFTEDLEHSAGTPDPESGVVSYQTR